MTTIAFDGRYVAADSQVCYGSCRGAGSVIKLRRSGDAVYALTGAGALFEPMIAWVEGGAKPDAKPPVGDSNDTALLVFRNGEVAMYKISMPYPEVLTAPDAWGSGAEFAIGAMHAGAKADQAVAIAIRCDVHSGGPVQVIDLHALQAKQELAA